MENSLSCAVGQGRQRKREREGRDERGQREQLIRCQSLRFLHSQFLLFVFFCVARSADLRSQHLEVRVAVADGPVDDGRLARAQQLLRNGVVNGDHIQLHNEQNRDREVEG